MPLDIISGGRGSGKTTTALIKLAKAGGGVFITRHIEQTQLLMKRLSEDQGIDTSTISLFSPAWKLMVVDDADNDSTVIVTMIHYKPDIGDA